MKPKCHIELLGEEHFCILTDDSAVIDPFDAGGEKGGLFNPRIDLCHCSLVPLVRASGRASRGENQNDITEHISPLLPSLRGDPILLLHVRHCGRRRGVERQMRLP